MKSRPTSRCSDIRTTLELASSCGRTTKRWWWWIRRMHFSGASISATDGGTIIDTV